MMNSGSGSPASKGHISQRRWFAAVIGLAVAIVLWTPAFSWGDSDDNDVVYIESNSIAGNSILAFRNDGNGNLSLIGNTPTHGNGIFDPLFRVPPQNATFDSDQQIQVDRERKLLFAVNSGSNSVAVFYIQSDGSLQELSGSPFPSGGSQPVSVGLKENLLVVANKDEWVALPPSSPPCPTPPVPAFCPILPPQDPFLSQPNYTSFRVSDDGEITPVPNSSVTVAYFSSPSQVLTASRGDVVFSTDVLGGLLQSFHIDEDGRLRQNRPMPVPPSVYAGNVINPITGLTLAKSPHYMIGLRTHPKLPILYVGYTIDNKLGVYRYDDRGNPSFVRAVANSGSGICWIVVNRDGTRIYTVNTFDLSVSVYDSTDPLNPFEIQHLRLVFNTGAPFSLVLGKSDQFLYVLSERGAVSSNAASNAIHVLKVDSNNGTVNEVAGSPVTAAPFITGEAQAQGIAVF